MGGTGCDRRMEEGGEKRGGGRECKRGKAGALKETRGRIPRSRAAPQPQVSRLAIPKEAGVGVGMGLTIAEKL